MTIERILNRLFCGHFSIGHLTVYGRNAMHWGVTYWTKRWGYICFRLPLTCFGCWWPLYFYLSPNATPWASTFYVGGRGHQGRYNRALAKRRRTVFGHGFDTEANREALQELNEAPWQSIAAMNRLVRQ